MCLIGGMAVYQGFSGLPRSFSFGLTTITLPTNNRTLTIFDFAKYRPELFVNSVFASNSVPTITCFVIVVVGTVFLISRFKQSRQLRLAMKGPERPADEMSGKDIRLIRTVISICIIYIICATPNVFLYAASTIYPPLNIGNLYLKNFSLLLYVIGDLFQAISSSVNIFVYWAMGSKFKDTFRQTFLPCTK